MKSPALIMTGIAVVVGGITVIGGRFYLDQGARTVVRVETAAPAAPPVQRTTVVVAAETLRFGMELSSQQLKEVQWPAEAVPPGATATIAEFLKTPQRRVVLAPIEVNEPVLPGKVTGPDERATLSAILSPGMTAVTIALSEVTGVGGLVMPGDRVNVTLTRTLTNDDSFTEMLLQDVRVLAVDQVIDQRADKPQISRNATLEVMPQDAKRVQLAANIGKLAFILRKAGEQTGSALGRITTKELSATGTDTTASQGKRTATVKVTRNGKIEDYEVPAVMRH